MKRVLVVLLTMMSLFCSCERKQNVSVENSEATSQITETVDIEPSASQTSSRYPGIDFSKLPINPAMLDMWNEETRKEEDFQYRNSSLTSDKLNSISNDYIAKNGFSDIEQKVVGYWFALDGISQADQGLSFMDALRSSRYPRLAIYPNGYFVILWYMNTPGLMISEINDAVPINGLDAFRIRGKWRVVGNKIQVTCFQYLIGYEDEPTLYYNLQTPFELELVDLDALTPDHFSTQPFAAFAQPPEILEQIPQSLTFITQPAYFIKSYYSWEPDMNSPPPLLWSQLFVTAEVFTNRNNSKGPTLDDILTSTGGRLQERYWD